MYRRIAAAVVLASSVAGPLAAQNLDQVCQDIRSIKVGQWVEWNLSGQEKGSIRMAVIGTEQRQGTPYYWLEMSMTDPDRGKMIMQDLVPGFPFQPADVQAIVMKAGDQPAMRMPEQMVQMMRSRAPKNPGMDFAQSCKAGKVIGWESVTVPAGTFKALHLEDTTSTGPGAERGDVWVSPDVAFGLVKVSTPKGSMELAAKGTDAKSQITETPKEIPMGPGN